MARLHDQLTGCLAAVLWLVGSLASSAAGPTEPDAASLEFFESKVRPILANRCYKCHSNQTSDLKGGLRLDLKQGIVEGGENGPVIEPGDVDSSRLIELVRYTDPALQMPPKGKLPAEEIATLEEWVRRGAPVTSDDLAHAVSAASAFNLAERKATHWAWQPVRTVAVPEVRDARWPADPIDRFVLARLEAEGLAPAPPADRGTLIRRAYFDLVGLPPSAQAVEAFVRDESPEAFARLVDRLLAAPAFGERWARHWLDLVRYAESRGHEFDFTIPGAWAYRDYAIRAFTQDLPYDRFVQEHIAGDLIVPPRMDAQRRINESLLGTAFWQLGEGVHSPVDIRQDELDRVDNQIDVMAKTFLGLTVACARCHDHKFDAIATRDYYSLVGFLHSSSYREAQYEWQEHNRDVAREVLELDAHAAPEVLAAFAGAVRPVGDRVAEYLLAAGDVLREKAAGTAATELAARAAQNESLDAAALSAWVAVLERARTEQADPLHPWAIVAGEPAEPSPQRLAALLQPVVTAWTSQRQHAGSVAAGTRCVIDYSAGPCVWITEGLAFGDGPAPVGSALLGSTAERPIARLFERAWARSDRVDRSLAGMLRTPEFSISGPVVWCRVAGVGQAFLCIDSHRLVQGPLHGETKKAIQSEQPIWLSFNVRDYQGQRAHVEFSAAGGQSLAIQAIYQGDAPPPDPAAPNGLALALLEQGLPNARAELAARYAALIGDTLKGLGNNALGANANPVEAALPVERVRFAWWLVERADALGFAAADRSKLTSLLADYSAQRASVASRFRPSNVVPAMLDGTAFDESVLVRGNPRTPGEVAHRRLLEALVGPDSEVESAGSGRLELAGQLTDPANPLVARVLVNRLWQHLFGRGIVATVDNFGVLGERPTHPELLDHLASQFVQDDWSIKRTLRRVMLSASYQMAATASAEALARDPENRLLSHARVRRLEAEAIRDSLLAVAGSLDQKSFGPSIPVHLTPFMEGRGRPGESGPLDGAGRRSIYIGVRRNFLPPMMLAFDAPVPFNAMGRRTSSNVPAQALILLNDPFVLQQAQAWATRVLAAPGLSPEQRVQRMYADALARPPASDELTAALAFLQAQAQAYDLPSETWEQNVQPWADLAHVLVNTKEFIFIQ